MSSQEPIMQRHNTINYIEFPVKDLPKAKRFFSQVFGWTFVDFGPEYCSISNASIDAGFFQSDKTMSTESGSALIVIYSDNLDKTQEKIVGAGGKIVKPIFSFPGGRRFHFCDSNNNEFAVWCDK